MLMKIFQRHITLQYITLHYISLPHIIGISNATYT